MYSQATVRSCVGTTPKDADVYLNDVPFALIGTTDETPSNNEMIPYLPLLTALAGVAPLPSVWLLKVLLCTGKTLQQAVPGVQGGGLSCFNGSQPEW